MYLWGRYGKRVYMGFQSILYGDSGQLPQAVAPDFFGDLQLDYLVERMKEGIKEYDISPYFYSLPKSQELIKYRQDICQDMTDEGLCEVIAGFCRGLQSSRSYYKLSEDCESEVHSATYYLKSATCYFDSLVRFKQELDKCVIASEGVKELMVFVKELIDDLTKSGFAGALESANKSFDKLQFSLAINQENIVIEEAGKLQGNCFGELIRLLGEDAGADTEYMQGVFPNPLETSKLEKTIINILKKSNPEIFKEICSFKGNFPDFRSEKLYTFEREVQFYLAFMSFMKKTKSYGYSMCVPQMSKDGTFEGRGVYDLALVWKSAGRDYTVVPNDFAMKKSPSFFVVTGPNQGGKTTFARAMGQAVYFSLMGLYANADEYILPPLKGLVTHFEAEEKFQSNSGKLKEEINRLAPMMKQELKEQYVILNELFTTATTHDALIMGKKVMEHFLDRDCYGIYVTHIQELAAERENIISMVAQLEERDYKRTYRILPMKAQGYGYSESLVSRYQLVYEDVIRRLS